MNRFLFNLRARNAHGLHSPFVYELYTQIINPCLHQSGELSALLTNEFLPVIPEFLDSSIFVLPSQFDEYIWFNTSQAVTPITTDNVIPKLLESHPFG